MTWKEHKGRSIPFGNPTKPTTLFENDALSEFFDGCWPLQKYGDTYEDPQRLKENVPF